MTGYLTIKQIRLGPRHEPTGKTRHSSGSVKLPTVALLKIATYADAEGYYLLHFDEDGNEITDTFHESVKDAMAQAKWEYQVDIRDWQDFMN